MQTLSDKAAAIESLLPFIYAHLDAHPAAMHVQRYGDSDGDVHGPSVTYYAGCNGRCFTCMAYFHATLNRRPNCPPEERWITEGRRLRRDYRITDLEQAILRLTDYNRLWAQAVWMTYVEPWPEWMPRQQADLAQEGVQWMAYRVPGDVLGYGERRDPVENQIRQLASQGYTQRRITKELRCDRNKVRAVLSADAVRCEQR